MWDRHDHQRPFKRGRSDARLPCGPIGEAPSPAVDAAWRRAHVLVMREAKCFELWRRELAPTGVQAAAHPPGREPGEYSRSTAREAPRESLRPLAVDEPNDGRKVVMLLVLSAEEAAYYAEEKEVVDPAGKKLPAGA